uniref:Uncharacterized protein n=1 Tax=Candidatus Kentrum sp. SD TaxID=2126332 RepID=A0A450YWK1_9GAMM|nr:MAG: hypothetical protein BECKSD772F_GA0070984_106018 [Candidatus Kentron sp. SD]VFK45914.1 MAG: hypothetical protein BECKSD772E_GA0070983_106317 [Candidatus Kentron sp. SD]
MRISILTKRLLHLDENKLEPESTDSGCPFCSSTNRQRVYILMYRKNKNFEGLSKQGNRLSNEGDYYQQRKTEAGN